MRPFASAFLALAFIFFVGGCDNTEPDVPDLPFARLELRLSPDAGSLVMATITGNPDFESGTVAVLDTLVLEPDQSYQGRIDFFDGSGTNVTARIRDDAEVYQILLSLLRASGATVAVTDTERSYGENTFGADLPVGLQFQLNVGENVDRGDAALQVRFGLFQRGRKNGITLEGTPIVDVEVPIFFDVPPPRIPNERITQATLTLERTDGTERWIVEAVNSFALNLGGTSIPSDLSVLRCVPNDSGGETCDPPPFPDPNTITLLPGEYQGRWDLADHLENQDLTQAILDAGNRHAFRYSSGLEASLLQLADADSLGHPIGVSFVQTIPTGVIINGGFVSELFHFDPNRGEPKVDGVSTSPRDLHFRIPLLVLQNGRPEVIHRAEFEFARVGTDEVSRVVAVGGEFGVFDGSLDSLGFEACSGNAPNQTCVPTDSLELAGGSDYSGTVQLIDDDGGSMTMEEIVREAEHHLFTFDQFLGGATMPTDTDVNGRPVGFSFALTSPAAGDVGVARISLSHYGRFGFKEAPGNFVELDLDLSFPVKVVD